MDTTKKVLISYWPLLEYDIIEKPGDTIENTVENAETIVERLSVEVPPIAGVMWGGYPFDAKDWDSASAIPIFLMDRAADVANHLIAWLEGDNDRFTLYFEQRETGYAVLLTPNIQKSIERWKTARLMYHEEIVTDNDFIIYFQSLGTCCIAGSTYKEIKTKIENPCYIGFLDLKDVNADNPKDMDSEKIIIAGPFKVGDPDDVVLLMDNLFESTTEPVQSKLNE